MKTTDGEIVWGPDPFLTPLGESQAVNIGAAWAKEQKAGAPIGHDEMRWYTSPFTRAIQTLERSWKNLRPDRVEAWEVGQSCNQD
jgi:broad specificity phosphatase PhoE